MKGNNKKLIGNAILFSVDSIKDDIRKTINIDDNLKRAEAIRILCEAYATLRRGKGRRYER